MILYLSEESLKNHVTVNILKLVDNKILEEYKNGRLHMGLIDSTEKIL